VGSAERKRLLGEVCLKDLKRSARTAERLKIKYAILLFFRIL